MNVTCSAVPCPIVLNSKCVVYEGGSLVYTNINTNDSLQLALQKLDSAIGNLSAGGLVALAPIGSSPNANGATLISGVLVLQPADATFGGVLTAIAQTIAGAKTFSDELTLSTISHAASDTNTFLVSDGGEIKYRTGAEILSDIGAGIGSVTSIDITPGIGISSSGGPITTNGSITITNTAPDQVVVLTQGSGITITGTYPSFTIANSSPSSGGTVTNVSALTLGTSGTDLSSSVANPTTTPVITLNVPTASASNRGALSSTDWSTFNNKQPAGNYITALTGEGTASGPGSVALTLDNSAVIGKVLSGLSVSGTTILSTDTILQAFGKTQNQINLLLGGVSYQGTWNASTNSPTLTSSVGTKGYYYVVDVAGSTNLNGITDWKLGDWAIFNGAAWEKVDNTDAVISVNGQTGIVNLALASSDFANQGTTTTVLHGNASGNPSWSQIVDGDIATGTIANNKLANSAITIGSTSISLGATSTTLAGLTSVTSTSFVGALTGNATTATNATNATNIGTIVDNSTNATVYPTWVLNGTASNQQPTISPSRLSLNPSTGALTATSFIGAGTGLTGTAASLTAGNATTATSTAQLSTSDNTSTGATFYPLIQSAINSTGVVYTSSTKFFFNPNTGVLSATSFSGAGTGLTGTASGLTIGGSAATLTTTRTIWGQNFNGSANVSGAASGMTTLGLSGTITSTVTGGASALFEALSATTNTQYFHLQNTGNDMYYGLESSTGGSVFTGSTAYASVFGTLSAKPVEFGTNGNVRYSISSGGNHDFKSGTAAFGSKVTILGPTNGDPALRVSLASSSGLQFVINNNTFGTTDATGLALYQNNAGGAAIRNNNIDAVSISTAGNVTLSGTLGINGTADNVKGSTYTPTITNVSNTSGISVSDVFIYSRVGNTVTVSGAFQVTATLATSSSVDITLPVASTFTTGIPLRGVGSSTIDNFKSFYVQQSATTASLGWNSAGVGATGTVYVMFQYRVS